VRESVQIFALVLVFIFSLNFFQSTPFESIFFQAQLLFYFFLFLFGTVFFIHKVLRQVKMSSFDLYMFFLAAVIPVYLAIRASVVFGQPLWYGIAAERHWLVVLAAVWLHHELSAGRISIQTVKKTLLLMAWATLIVFVLIQMLIDPGPFVRTPFASFSKIRGFRFRLNYFFIIYGAIYYFISYTKTHRFPQLLKALAFSVYIVLIIQGRAMLLFLFITACVYLIVNKSFQYNVKLLLKASLAFSVLLIFCYVMYPSIISKYINLYHQAGIVLSGHMGEDYSANSRILQVNEMLLYLKTHSELLWFGAGRLSYHWNGGFSRVLGYFYPSDTGLIGMIFVYGIVGIMVVLFSVIFYIRSKCSELFRSDVFALSIKYYGLYFIFLTLVTGAIVFQASRFMLLMAIMTYICEAGVNDKEKT